MTKRTGNRIDAAAQRLARVRVNKRTARQRAARYVRNSMALDPVVPRARVIRQDPTAS